MTRAVSKSGRAADAAAPDRLGSAFAALRRPLSGRILAYAAVASALLLGIASFALLSREALLDDQGGLVNILLLVDVVALGVLLVFVGGQVYGILAERRKRLAGYQLHLRLVSLFGVVTITPAIIIVAFSLFVLDYSLRGWFSERISTAITESVTVADAYLGEHIQTVEGQILAMANDINREAGTLSGDRRRFDAYLTNQAGVRNLSEAIVVDSTGRVIATSRFAYSVTFSGLDEEFFDTARGGEVAMTSIDETNRIRAGVRLNQFVDAYLLVGRFIDPKVSTALDRTRTAASEYQVLDIRQFDLKISFALLFGMVALLLLLGSIWIGLNLATAIIEPLAAVIGVAERVRGGDLGSRVGVTESRDEVAMLGRSFNRMLDEIDRNREKLVDANRQIDKRREFTEAVLGGVSSGVVGVDKDGTVTLPNTAALTMLGIAKMDAIGKKLDVLVPEFGPLLEAAGRPGRRNKEQNIEIQRDGGTLNLLARIATETVDNRIVGYVVTFEDVSELLDAQRKAAWADVARRIAHEIKNPLTPIQLAAERLGAKYTPSEEDRRSDFTKYIDTISRQVGDIGRLVDEFSAFARMPAPVMARHNLVEMVGSQISLFDAGRGSVTFDFETGGLDDIPLVCDDGMIRQVVTNLLQNAVDAMAQAKVKDRRILVEAMKDGQDVELLFVDNGPGLPDKKGADLTAPYVTFRKGGTGLGLAIVRKIVEDHDGRLELGASTRDGYKGAAVTITLPGAAGDGKA